MFAADIDVVVLMVRTGRRVYLSNGPLDHGAAGQGGPVDLLVVVGGVGQVVLLHLLPDGVAVAPGRSPTHDRIRSESTRGCVSSQSGTARGIHD